MDKETKNAVDALIDWFLGPNKKKEKVEPVMPVRLAPMTERIIQSATVTVDEHEFKFEVGEDCRYQTIIEIRYSPGVLGERSIKLINEDEEVFYTLLIPPQAIVELELETIAVDDNKNDR